jgi:hypothetical protein
MIENQILSWLKVKNIFGFKVKTVGTFDQKLGRFRKPSLWYRLGVSDIICCHWGRFIALEVKTKTGSLSVNQKLFIGDVKASGGFAFTVRSIEEVQLAFEQVYNAIIEEETNEGPSITPQPRQTPVS